MDDYKKVHESAIVFDASCCLLNDENYIDWSIEGGVTVAAPTVGCDDGCAKTMKNIGRWLRILREREQNLNQVTEVEDFTRAKEQGKLGILFHFQNTLPLERSLELVDVYRALGVRVIQLTYNVRNAVGDGCDERTDTGLSDFGVKLVKAMNRAGITVDCSHTGVQTTLDAMEVSELPVVFSHSNARAICDSPRNLTDEQIKGVAAMGGVIGLNGFPAFVAKKPRPSLDDLLKHADYIAGLVGIDHVGVGLDYYSGIAGVSSLEASAAQYKSLIESGRWKSGTYPPPPYHFPEGLEDPRCFPNLTRALLERGYTEKESKKVLGGNFMRVYSQTWK
jgi:membrane dipeptidase